MPCESAGRRCTVCYARVLAVASMPRIAPTRHHHNPFSFPLRLDPGSPASH